MNLKVLLRTRNLARFTASCVYTPYMWLAKAVKSGGNEINLRALADQDLERFWKDIGNWDSAATVPIPIAGQTVIDPTATIEPQRFYRTVLIL